MSETTDSFVAFVHPQPDGRYEVSVWERHLRDANTRPVYLERRLGVTCTRYVRSERAARKAAIKMLARVRKAQAFHDRESFEVSA